MTTLPSPLAALVLIAGFDDIPAHQFLVRRSSRTASQALPSQVPLLGSTENQTSRWFCRSYRDQPKPEQASGKGLVPAPPWRCSQNPNPSHKPGQLPQKGDVMSPQIKYAYKTHNTWVYRRTYPKALQPLLGSALKQSLKTGDAT